MDDSVKMTSSDDIPLYFNLHDDKEDLTESPILNKTVRTAYYQYLKLLISKNLSSTDTCMSEKNITALAQKLELHAVKACMSSLLYRYIMVQEITNIKRMTATNVSATNMNLYNTGEFMNGEKMLFEHFNAHFDNTPYADNDCDSIDKVQVGNKDITSELIQEDNPQSVFVDTHFYGKNKDKMSHSKSHEQTVIKEPTLNDPKQTNNVLNASAPQETETIYQRVYEEMSMMFSAEQQVTHAKSSPLCLISSNRFDNHFWTLEAENNKAQFQQIMSSMRELNKEKYEIVLEILIKIFGENLSIDSNFMPMKKLTKLCKERITWHVKTSLTVYYRKKRFRSVDEFRILAKTIVTRLLQINPYMKYQVIYRAISTVFDRRRSFLVQNLSHIQYVESKVLHYVSLMIK